MTIHRIKLKDLNEAFIQQLRKELADEEAELTIWLPETVDREVLSEEGFWEIMDRLDWDSNDPYGVIEPVIQYLSEQPVAVIEAFEDLLSEKLYRLDGQQYAEQVGENAYRGEEHPFSADEFLYARCYVVAQGKQVYEEVLTNPEEMPKDVGFERLLRVASAAFKRRTGEEWGYVPTYIVETFANGEGWENEDLVAKILS